MEKRVALAVVVLAAWGLFAGLAAAAQKIDNPVYQDWARFKPGSFVTHKAVADMGAMTSETTITNTLKQVTPEKVVVEMAMVTKVAGQDMKMPPQTMEHPAKIDKPEEMEAPEGMAKPKELDRGAEELTISGKKIKTTWIKTELKQADMTVVSTVWNNADIPGQMVKMVSEMKGPMTTKTKMVLVDYKADKKKAD